jgi:hypothetical protein
MVREQRYGNGITLVCNEAREKTAVWMVTNLEL